MQCYVNIFNAIVSRKEKVSRKLSVKNISFLFSKRDSSVAFQVLWENGKIGHRWPSGRVIFDKVVLNKGNGYVYQPSSHVVVSGIFRVKEEGFYAFHWTCKTNTNSTLKTELIVNSRDYPKAKNWASSSGRDESVSGSQTYVTGLKEEDEVWIQVKGDETPADGGLWSSFTGYRM